MPVSTAASLRTLGHLPPPPYLPLQQHRIHRYYCRVEVHPLNPSTSTTVDVIRLHTSCMHKIVRARKLHTVLKPGGDVNRRPQLLEPVSMSRKRRRNPLDLELAAPPLDEDCLVLEGSSISVFPQFEGPKAARCSGYHCPTRQTSSSPFQTKPHSFSRLSI